MSASRASIADFVKSLVESQKEMTPSLGVKIIKIKGSYIYVLCIKLSMKLGLGFV